jgi:hypothetical protein
VDAARGWRNGRRVKIGEPDVTTTISKANEPSHLLGLTPGWAVGRSRWNRASLRSGVFGELHETTSSPGAAFLSGTGAMVLVLLAFVVHERLRQGGREANSGQVGVLGDVRVTGGVC